MGACFSRFTDIFTLLAPQANFFEIQSLFLLYFQSEGTHKTRHFSKTGETVGVSL